MSEFSNGSFRLPENSCKKLCCRAHHSCYDGYTPYYDCDGSFIGYIPYIQPTLNIQYLSVHQSHQYQGKYIDKDPEQNNIYSLQNIQQLDIRAQNSTDKLQQNRKVPPDNSPEFKYIFEYQNIPDLLNACHNEYDQLEPNMQILLKKVAKLYKNRLPHAIDKPSSVGHQNRHMPMI